MLKYKTITKTLKFRTIELNLLGNFFVSFDAYTYSKKKLSKILSKMFLLSSHIKVYNMKN